MCVCVCASACFHLLIMFDLFCWGGSVIVKPPPHPPPASAWVKNGLRSPVGLCGCGEYKWLMNYRWTLTQMNLAGVPGLYGSYLKAESIRPTWEHAGAAVNRQRRSREALSPRHASWWHLFMLNGLNITEFFFYYYWEKRKIQSVSN